jgi:chemotaxis protein CheD
MINPRIPNPAPATKTLVTQGGFATSANPDEMLTTVLGSCICTCLHDPVARLGGLNHFLLGEQPGSERGSSSYGAYCMEVLINDLLKRGARRERLQAKIAGGARMLSVATDIGQRNTTFARQFLANEGIALIGENTGGDQARRIRFWPATGRTQVMLVQNTDTAEIESAIARKPPAKDMGDVELF